MTFVVMERGKKMDEIKPCPFCGWKGKVSFKDYKFSSKNFNGDIKIKYRVQVICNKCRSRGKPIITDWLLNPNPYISEWGNVYSRNSLKCEEQTNMFRTYVSLAIGAWNRRV